MSLEKMSDIRVLGPWNLLPGDLLIDTHVNRLVTRQKVDEMPCLVVRVDTFGDITWRGRATPDVIGIFGRYVDLLTPQGKVVTRVYVAPKETVDVMRKLSK